MVMSVTVALPAAYAFSLQLSATMSVLLAADHDAACRLPRTLL
jgi:hypothetical protein